MEASFEIIEDKRKAISIYDYACDIPSSEMCEMFPEDDLAFICDLLEDFLEKMNVGSVYRKHVCNMLSYTDLDKYDRVIAYTHTDGNVSVCVLVSQK